MQPCPTPLLVRSPAHPAAPSPCGRRAHSACYRDAGSGWGAGRAVRRSGLLRLCRGQPVRRLQGRHVPPHARARAHRRDAARGGGQAPQLVLQTQPLEPLRREERLALAVHPGARLHPPRPQLAQYGQVSQHLRLSPARRPRHAGRCGARGGRGRGRGRGGRGVSGGERLGRRRRACGRGPQPCPALALAPARSRAGGGLLPQPRRSLLRGALGRRLFGAASPRSITAARARTGRQHVQAGAGKLGCRGRQHAGPSPARAGRRWRGACL